MRIISFIVLAFTAFITSFAVAQEVPVAVPDGFAIEKVAGNDLVPDASAMTVDPKGAPIVSGPGYIRRMVDDDGDGSYDAYETLASPKGIAQGVWFDGNQMWLTVDGALKRSLERKGGQPFTFETVVQVTTDTEHGSHAIRKGPDGWWYVICGNATEIRSEYFSLASSPVKEPRAGFVMRFPADVGTGAKFAAEILCHGFRNAYDFDFDADGNVFVYDSDGERDVSLPWYRPTRVFRMEPGGDAGWVSASWKRPASFHDMPELVGQFGRGSPTGVAVCRSSAFGAQYKGDVFVGDWTFGRIGVARSGFEVEVFAKPEGNFGFAITDLEFSPRGELYVTTGGRGTEGALYRISRKGDDSTEKSREAFLSSLNKVVAKKKLASSPSSSSFADGLLEATTCDDDRLAYCVRELQRKLGGCNGSGMFAGHWAASLGAITDEDRASMPLRLKALLARDIDTFEVARLIGMLQPKDNDLANSLAMIAAEEKDPVERIHYLNCLAMAQGKLSTETVELVANALLRIRREIDEADLPVDRNWVPRMKQLSGELFRDMRIPESIVRDSSFGQQSDIWMFDLLPEIFRKPALSKIAAKVKDNPDGVTREQLKCLTVVAEFMDLVRTFAANRQFSDIVVKAVYLKPKSEDWKVLLRGLDSFDLNVNKASLIGLRKVKKELTLDDLPTPYQDGVHRALKLEKRLGWTNPEVSVRNQMMLLLHKWGLKGRVEPFGYDLSPADIKNCEAKMLAVKDWARSEMDVDLKDEEVSLAQMEVDFSRGDSVRGEVAFKKFQCANCHNGRGQNSGPSLDGIASRFSREDIFKAILRPNDSVPERYRAVVVATEDGQLFQGSVVYESMAGIMLATGSGEIVRIDAANIESRRKTQKSLMPEGLMTEATDAEVADLWAYLEKL